MEPQYATRHAGLVLLLLLLCSGHMASTQDWISGYGFRKTITIDHTDVSGTSDLIDFPFLVSVTDNDLRTTGNGGRVQNGSGFDIVFAGADMISLLEHQVESYNPSTGELVAWVKIPTLSHTTDTDINVYYGNSAIAADPSTTAVWDDYVGVYHLHDDLNDATANGFDATASGNSNATGQVADGEQLSTAATAIITTGITSMATSFTVSGWFNATSFSSNFPRVFQKGAGETLIFINNQGTSGPIGALRFQIDGWDDTDWWSTTTLSTGTTYYIALTYDGSNVSNDPDFYIDGTLDAIDGTRTLRPTSGAASLGSGAVTIGNRSTTNREFNGWIDEFRLSNVIRSADWIQTEYNNQLNPASFVTFASEESCTAIGGSAVATDGDLNFGESTTVTLTGETGTIQWQSSTDGTTFSNLSGETSSTLNTGVISTTTYYRALVTTTCTVASNVVTVTVNTPFINYQYRKLLTINNAQVCGGGTYTDFPVLINITDSDLQTSAGRVQNTNGYDIVFTGVDGASLLNHQIESYDGTTGEYVAWVQVPSLSATTDTEIYMYYGSSAGGLTDPSTTATWDANYRAVYHLDGNFNDGSANVFNGTNNGTGDVPGQIGGARSFDGSADWIDLGANRSFIDNVSVATLSAWVYLGPSGRGAILSISKHTGATTTDSRAALELEPSLEIKVGGRSADSDTYQGEITTGSISRGTWHYLSGVIDYANDDVKIYLDGVVQGTTGTPNFSATATSNATSDNGGIGSQDDGSANFFPGTIDEVRVSDIERSAEWICTEYNNQSAPGAFVTIGAETACTTTPGSATADAFELTSGQTTTLTVTGHSGTIQWQSSSDNINFTDLAGETAATLSTGPITARTHYRAVITDGCEAITNTVTIRLRPAFSVYQYRKRITIPASNVSANLMDFPLLVSVTDTDLATASGKVLDANGYDIAFTADDGSSTLDHEIERYDGATGTFIGWVRIPTLSASVDTEIYMYYGNCVGPLTDPSTPDVWDGNFRAVYHLSQSFNDATINGFDATNVGTNDANTQIGRGRSFSNDAIDMGDDRNFISGVSEATLSAWIFIDPSGDGDIIAISENNGGAGTGASRAAIELNTDLTIRVGGRAGDGESFTARTTTAALSRGVWYYVTGIFDYANDDIKIYVDGVDQGTTGTPNFVATATSSTTSDNSHIGNSDTGAGAPFPGDIDEVRVSDVVRSPEWISTEYLNQSDPSSFYTIDAETIEYQWTGAVDTDWNNTSNWAGCQVPTAGSDIQILSGVSNFPVLDTDRQIGSLRIGSGATMDLSTHVLTLEGDIVNGGSLTSTGTLSFTGSSAQSISGGGSYSINNLTLNNSNELYATSALTIDGTLTLTSGHLFLADQVLTIGNSGALSGFSSASYLVTTGTGCLRQNNIGGVGRTGDIDFPVGTSSSSYTPVTINNTPGTADAYCVKVSDNVYLEGGDGTGTLITNEAVNKTWFITESVASGSDVTLTLQWNAADEQATFDRSSSAINHYGTFWSTVGASGPATDLGGGAYSLTASSLSDFSPFAVGSGDGPLPVELSDFRASQKGNVVEIQWSTATETNNSHFTLERSGDSNAFEAIATIPTIDGNSLEAQQYLFVDDRPINGANHYRLSQEDVDGTTETLGVVLVIFRSDLPQSLIVAGNPVKGGTLKIVARHELSNALEIQIQDLSGKVVQHVTILPDRQSRNQIIPLSRSINSGVYLLSIRDGDFLFQEEIIVE